jgi:cysteine synthase
MFDDIFKTGKVTSETIFIEPTSGNTGIGLAYVAAARKLKLILIMPEHLSDERKKMFKLLGAKLVLTPKTGGMKASIEKAKELNALIPGSVILQQFENPSNPRIHRYTTAEEIWSDTNGQVDYLVSGVGTGGTITGIGQVLKSR